MEFTLMAKLPADAGAVLYICNEKAQLHDDAARAVFNSLDEKAAFAEAKLLQNGSLQAVAVWRLADTELKTLQNGAREAAAWAAKQERAAVCLDALCAVNAPRVADVLVSAVGEAVYRFDRFKSEPQPAKLAQTVFVCEQHGEAVAAALAAAEAVLYGVNLCKDLGNNAPNVCTPAFLAETAAAEAEKFGASAKIFGKDYIQQNMPSFWGVAKGSVQEPRLVELSYFGAADKNAAPVVFVGKGLTFDSGGISIKPSANMDEMKYDMCGAAAVIGAFVAAVKAKLPVNLIAVVASCENMPDGGSCKPGDIVKAMNGTTIENLNTDAEGRLVLCDALTYVEQFNPKVVIDAATLTGSCVMTFGGLCTGLMSNNESLTAELVQASRETNDKVWELPLFEEYKEQLKSPFADLQNIGGREAGAITAGLFLSHFTEKYDWAHLDIAGTAWKSGANKGATGRPVPLLVQYLKNQIGK